MEAKQVIVMRKDLGMRKGKMIAQGAHAAMAVLLDLMPAMEGKGQYVRVLREEQDSWCAQWLKGRFKKVCVSVNSEEALLEVHDKAKAAGIPTALITDSGLTEFGGVPTNTCVAVGPWNPEEIDKITGELPLL